MAKSSKSDWLVFGLGVTSLSLFIGFLLLSFAEGLSLPNGLFGLEPLELIDLASILYGVMPALAIAFGLGTVELGAANAYLHWVRGEKPDIRNRRGMEYGVMGGGFLALIVSLFIIISSF